MSLLLRRREMIRSASGGGDDIPIGVELLDSSQFVYKRYYRGTRNGQSLIGYAGSSGNTYTMSGPVPYNSDYDFSFVGTTVTGNTTSWAVDENMIVRGGEIESVTNDGIKAAVKSIEQEYGYKIKYLALTLVGGTSPLTASVIRIA